MEDTARILVLYTGGTIGMRPTPRGYSPAPGHLVELLRTLPSFHEPGMPLLTTPVSRYGHRAHYEIVEYDPIIDSSNMRTGDWSRIARDIHASYADHDAFIVLHGTDTMAYTAAALSFALDGLDKPVVLTGSQIPLSHHRNDATDNLLGALTFAGQFSVPEVCIYFHDKVLRGNRSHKADALGLDAFRSENCPPLAVAGVDFSLNWDRIRVPQAGQLQLRAEFCSDVVSVRLFPGIPTEVVRNCLAPPVRGAVLESFGTGNAPDNRPELIAVLEAAMARGVVLVNCSQCARGAVDRTYATGSVLADIGVQSGVDMRPETALVKLGWLLAQDLPPAQLRSAISADLRGELSPPASSQELSFRDRRLARAVSALLRDSPESREAERSALYPMLMCAAAGAGDLNALRALILAGVSPNAVDYDQRTPLHLAASMGRAEAVALLLHYSASPSARDRWGHTPADEARRAGHEALAATLRAASTGEPDW